MTDARFRAVMCLLVAGMVFCAFMMLTACASPYNDRNMAGMSAEQIERELAK